MDIKKNKQKRPKQIRFLPLWPVVLLLLPKLLQAQTAPPDIYIRIDTIIFEGNRKTRPALILRELEFQAGDSLSLLTLPQTLERNRLRVMNLGLFTSSTVSLDTIAGGSGLAVRFKVVEMWYIFPIPLFELADRNFNVWWTEFNRSLKRVNYGISWTHLNLTGNADILKVNLNFGYTNRYEIVYERPWFNRRQTLGLRGAFGFSRNHEVAYRTDGNKQLFSVDQGAWQKRRYYANAGIQWRPKLLTEHALTLEFHHNKIADTISRIVNPDFFLQGRTAQRHFSLVYRLSLDHRDIRPYPLSGWFALFELRQNGLLPGDDLHLFRAFAEYRKYFPFTRRLSLETVFKGRLGLPRRQPPFFNNQALGYGDNLVRGYEFFVMDGLDYGLFRSSLHINLLDRQFNLKKVIPLKAFQVMPVKIFLSVNNDAGYANDPYYAANNSLTNRMLYGYGLGLDIITFYNKVAKFEWTWKGTGGGGFFVNINMGI